MQVTYTGADIKVAKEYNSYFDQIQHAYIDALKDIKSTLGTAGQALLDAEGKLDFEKANELQGQISRLQKIEKEISADLNEIMFGQEQKINTFKKKVYDITLEEGAKEMGHVLGVNGLTFDMLNRDAVYFATQRPMAKIAILENQQAVYSNIQKALTMSVVQGETINQLTERIQIALEQNANRAVRIARTEMTGIQGMARESLQNEAIDLGMDIQKQWMATFDDRTRDSHYNLHGEVADENGIFPNGLKYPGDQAGGPAEVVNCRCTMVTKLLELEEEWGPQIEKFPEREPKPIKVKASGKLPTGPKISGAPALPPVPKATKPIAKPTATTSGAKKQKVTKNALNKTMDEDITGARFPDYLNKKDPFIAEQNKYLRTLSRDQHVSIYDYTTHKYEDINDRLRKTGKFELDDILRMRSIADAPPLKEPITVARRITPGGMRSFMGKDTEEMYNTAKTLLSKGDTAGLKKHIDQMNAVLQGTKVSDPAFMSTTIKEATAQALRIHLPTGYNGGLYISEVSNYKDEFEFLIRPSQEFIVTGVRVITGNYRWAYEEIVIDLIPKP